MNPKVSIITALHNAEKFIEQTAKSVAEQTYKNIRWVICDDLSTDKSVDKVISLMNGTHIPANIFGLSGSQGFIEGIDTLLILNDKNSKQGRARNLCINASKDADLYKNLDADDYLLPTCIENHVREWLKSPEEISCVYSDYFIQDDSTGLTTYEYKQSFSYEELHRHCIVSSGCVFPRWALEKVGLYFEDESPCEDYGLELRLSNVGTMIHLANAEWVYRLHGNNATIKDLDKHKAAFPIMQKNYQQWMNQR